MHIYIYTVYVWFYISKNIKFGIYDHICIMIYIYIHIVLYIVHVAVSSPCGDSEVQAKRENSLGPRHSGGTSLSPFHLSELALVLFQGMEFYPGASLKP